MTEVERLNWEIAKLKVELQKYKTVLERNNVRFEDLDRYLKIAAIAIMNREVKLL